MTTFFNIASTFVITMFVLFVLLPFGSYIYNTNHNYKCPDPGYRYSSLFGLHEECVFSEAALEQDHHPNKLPDK